MLDQNAIGKNCMNKNVSHFHSYVTTRHKKRSEFDYKLLKYVFLNMYFVSNINKNVILFVKYVHKFKPPYF